MMPLIIQNTRSCATLRAADLDWIVGPSMIQFGRKHFGVFSKSRFLPPALSSWFCSYFPTFWFLFFSQFQMTGSVDFSLLAGDPNWPFGCLDLSVSFCNIFVRSLSARLFVLLIERLVAVYIISNIKSTNFLYSPLHRSFNSFISHISKESPKNCFFFRNNS